MNLNITFVCLFEKQTFAMFVSLEHASHMVSGTFRESFTRSLNVLRHCVCNKKR